MTPDWVLAVWVVAATLGVVAATAAVVFPLGVRWGTRHAEHQAERDVVQAALWAQSPMDVLAFYARYRPNPPDFAAYMDDQIAYDPALEARTRRPAPRVRPAVPASDEVGKQENPSPPPAETVDEPAAGQEPLRPRVRPSATSHRAMRRPVVGWLEDTATGARYWARRAWARLGDRSAPVVDEETRQRIEMDMEVDRVMAAQAAAATVAPPIAAELGDPPAAPVIMAIDPALSSTGIAVATVDPDGAILALTPATLCARCKGTQRVDTTQPMLWQPCPDCCCPEPGCGLNTGGGFCPPHQDTDDLREEAAAKRTADV